MAKTGLPKITQYISTKIGRRQNVHNSNNEGFQFNRVLLLQKLSRLDMERLRNPQLSDSQLREKIINRGTDYNALKKHHDINATFQEKALAAFEKSGIKTEINNRFTYSEKSLACCDAVFTLGGDGTYLLAANKISSNEIPLIGFNSDPCRSEGHLCLPKEFSSNIPAAIAKLQSGKFRWMFRSRIRIMITGGNIDKPPIELHQQATGPQLTDWTRKEESDNATKINECPERILPVLALNEVFLGENLSAKVSYFEVRINGSQDVTRVKSSGLLVCTGTGSTSWNLSTNRLNHQDVHEILTLYARNSASEINQLIVPAVCQQFNNRFIFSPEDSKIGYTIRDLIYAGVWPKPKGRLQARAFVDKIVIKSRCQDAGLVIDGGIVYPFNDGTTASLQTDSKAALKTVVMDCD